MGKVESPLALGRRWSLVTAQSCPGVQRERLDFPG